MYDLKDEHTKEEWLDITKIYRENKRKREIESERQNRTRNLDHNKRRSSDRR